MLEKIKYLSDNLANLHVSILYLYLNVQCTSIFTNFCSLV